MSVFGIAMVRDEADIIEATMQQMLSQVDAVIVADNGSTDGTGELLVALQRESADLWLMGDSDPAYYQSRKMSRLASIARDYGATWVVPFDADEWWYSPHGRIADVLSERPESIATAQLYNHMTTGRDPAEGNPVERIQWRSKEPLGLPKVACRTDPDLTIHAGNHGAAYPEPVESVGGLLEVRHFPYRSAAQFVRKAKNGAAAYAKTDLPITTGQHWREYGELISAEGDEAGEDWFRRYFWVADPDSDSSLIHDPVSALCPA